MQARKTFLFHEGVPWVKLSDSEDFDMLVGLYDSAETCNLVSAFVLNNLSHFIDNSSIGLYISNVLGVFMSHSGPKTERKQKEIIKIFNTYNLSITIETSIFVINFSETTLDLTNDIYKSYQ